MNQHIHCSVDNCHYWSSGNKCAASEIMVTSDSLAHRTADAVDAPEASTIDSTPAGSCMETCCKTFVTKGSDQRNVDGVKRM
jgi:hypothetical protein